MFNIFSLKYVLLKASYSYRLYMSYYVLSNVSNPLVK